MDWRGQLTAQSGVINRRQLTSYGLAPHDVRRLLRRRDLVPLHPGVYVDHTGEPTWHQRAWGAVLLHPPAALWGPSVLRALARTPPRDDSGPVHVAVESHRHMKAVPGVVVHRTVDLRERVHARSAPPRMRTEEAVLDVAAVATDELAAIAALTDAVQQKLVKPWQLTRALRERARITRRDLLVAVVKDLAEKTDSVLEHRYLTHVERPHGLPRGQRQVSLPGSSAVHDVVYDDPCVVVELDGRAHHSSHHQRSKDLDRDTTALLADHVTVRLGWSQVVGEPCRTASRVAALLAARGWVGSIRRCPRC